MTVPSTRSRSEKALSKTTTVPLLDLHRQFAGIREEILQAVERVCASQQFILGEEVETLESEIAAYTGSAAAVGCASGTDALGLALAAAGVGPGDTVITTPFSFFASAAAVARVGARPVFVDVDPGSLNLDPSPVDARLRSPSNKIKAVLPVHLFGQCADMSAFEQISQEFSVVIVEDAAQALGAAWKGKRAGSLGVAAAFSFYPTKNLNAHGEAGMVTTQDYKIAEHMRRLRNHGSSQRYHHEELGWNARMDAIQAAILRVKLPHLEPWNALRRKHAATYNRLFSGSGLSENGSSDSCAAVRPLEVSPQAHHIFHQYVVRAKQRDELRVFLSQRNIGSEIYYPVPLHLQPAFAYLGYSQGDFPIAEQAASEVLALPMFPELREDEQKYVVENIADFYS